MQLYGSRSVSRDHFSFWIWASNLDSVTSLLVSDLISETQGPEEMCLTLKHQNPSKTSEKMGYFDRVTVSLHILYTTNQDTEGSQDRLYSINLYGNRDSESSVLALPAIYCIRKLYWCNLQAKR